MTPDAQLVGGCAPICYMSSGHVKIRVSLWSLDGVLLLGVCTSWSVKDDAASVPSVMVVALSVASGVRTQPALFTERIRD
jgi:hypothetical protein